MTACCDMTVGPLMLLGYQAAGLAAFLTALRWKGVTVEELTGFAEAARSQARLPCAGMPGLVTLCPSHDGQDHHPPLEVAAGLVAAGAGARGADREREAAGCREAVDEEEGGE